MIDVPRRTRPLVEDLAVWLSPEDLTAPGWSIALDVAEQLGSTREGAAAQRTGSINASCSRNRSRI